MELAKAYDPQEAQRKWLAIWDQQGYFHAQMRLTSSSRPRSRRVFFSCA